MSKTARTLNPQIGFSLIEVLVAVALIGMLALVGTPAMLNWLEGYRVRTAAQEIAANLQLQRMRAIGGNRPFSIQFDVAAETYSLFDGAPGGWTMVDPQPHSFPIGVAYDGSGGDPVELSFAGNDDVAVFQPDGSVNDGSAVADDLFIANGSGDQYSISINRTTGRITVTKLSS